jgi:GNAT superfamily N-acetyltransferase
MVVLRAATRNDALSISRVHVSSWRTTYQDIVPAQFLNELNAEQRVSRWQQVIDSGSHLIVAENANRVVGFISGGPIREPLEGHDAELYAIYLLQNVQGKGIGTALLIELAKCQHDAGHSVIVWVLTANDSLGFYEKTGATLISQKEIEIGGAWLPVAAYAWPTIESLATLPPPNLSE